MSYVATRLTSYIVCAPHMSCSDMFHVLLIEQMYPQLFCFHHIQFLRLSAAFVCLSVRLFLPVWQINVGHFHLSFTNKEPRQYASHVVLAASWCTCALAYQWTLRQSLLTLPPYINSIPLGIIWDIPLNLVPGVFGDYVELC